MFFEFGDSFHASRLSGSEQRKPVSLIRSERFAESIFSERCAWWDGAIHGYRAEHYKHSRDMVRRWGCWRKFLGGHDQRYRPVYCARSSGNPHGYRDQRCGHHKERESLSCGRGHFSHACIGNHCSRGTQRFTARFKEFERGINWSVNKVSGGNSSVGTIARAGSIPLRRKRERIGSLPPAPPIPR